MTRPATPPTAPGRPARPVPEPATLTRPDGAAPREPRCTVGLLTWNDGDDATRCFASVLTQTERPLELLWVDNGSTNDTVARLRERYPEMPEPCINAENQGFCGGHNQLIAACRTPYYLALNSDIVLAPDYIEKLCDWLDERPELALASGLILQPPPPDAPPDAPEIIFSAGLVWPRARFSFELGMGRPATAADRQRRIVPGVDGSAMLLRMTACHDVALPPGEIFPEHFFIYSEEVDLALRLTRAGCACGVEGTTRAWHRARGSGGFQRTAIRARFFRNHWLLTLRHDSWATILTELPYLIKGELQHWLPEYRQHPAALPLALRELVGQVGAARAFYRAFERKFGPTAPALRASKQLALKELRQSHPAG